MTTAELIEMLEKTNLYDLRLSHKLAIIAGLKRDADVIKIMREALERIVSEGIDTSTDGGIEFVRHALEAVDKIKAP